MAPRLLLSSYVPFLINVGRSRSLDFCLNCVKRFGFCVAARGEESDKTEKDSSTGSSLHAALLVRRQIQKEFVKPKRQQRKAVWPVTLTWRDLSCYRYVDGSEKSILSGIHGRANPGEILALMGGSGAGKASMPSTSHHCLSLSLLCWTYSP